MGKDIRRGKGFKSEKEESMDSNTTFGKLKICAVCHLDIIDVELVQLNKRNAVHLGCYKSIQGDSDTIESDKTYWDTLPENEEGELIEPVEANPDQLMDYTEEYRNGREEFQGQLNDLQELMTRMLPPRELEAMQLLQKGLKYDKIAQYMKCKENTVKVLILRARRKLNLHIEANGL